MKNRNQKSWGNSLMKDKIVTIKSLRRFFLKISHSMITKAIASTPRLSQKFGWNSHHEEKNSIRTGGGIPNRNNRFQSIMNNSSTQQAGFLSKFSYQSNLATFFAPTGIQSVNPTTLRCILSISWVTLPHSYSRNILRSIWRRDPWTDFRDKKLGLAFVRESVSY